MRIVTTLLIALLSTSAAFADVPDGSESIDYRLSSKIKKYLNNALTVEKLRGSCTIDEEDVYQSNVLITDADAEIDGTIEGNLVAVNSNLVIGNDANIYGDLVLVNSSLQNDGANLYGELIKMEDAKLYSSVHRRRLGPVSWQFDDRTGASHLQFGSMQQTFVFQHNRVQGFYMGLRWPSIIGRHLSWVNAYGHIGYGFADKQWRYRLGLKRALWTKGRVYIGVNGYDEITSDDYWRVSKLENTIASLTFREDFYDYYYRRGWSAELSLEQYPLVVNTGYRREQQESAFVNTRWALFNPQKEFRLNPTALEGDYGIGFFNVKYTNVDNIQAPHSGVDVEFLSETSFSDLKSDFSYNYFFTNVSGFIPISRNETLQLRLVGGSLEGQQAPFQKIFRLGGPASVRGYRLNEATGNRMLLLNTEYRIQLGYDDSWFWFSDPAAVAVFSDNGGALFAPGNVGLVDGFDQFKWNHIKNSIGIGIILGDEFGRLDIARRTDTGKDAVSVYLRLKLRL